MKYMRIFPAIILFQMLVEAETMDTMVGADQGSVCSECLVKNCISFPLIWFIIFLLTYAFFNNLFAKLFIIHICLEIFNSTNLCFLSTFNSSITTFIIKSDSAKYTIHEFTPVLRKSKRITNPISWLTRESPSSFIKRLLDQYPFLGYITNLRSWIKSLYNWLLVYTRSFISIVFLVFSEKKNPFIFSVWLKYIYIKGFFGKEKYFKFIFSFSQIGMHNDFTNFIYNHFILEPMSHYKSTVKLIHQFSLFSYKLDGPYSLIHKLGRELINMGICRRKQNGIYQAFT